MQVDDLLAYQLVPSVVSAVRAAGIERLWPLQEKAIRAKVLASDGAAPPRDLLLAGPSASGKTFLLELCAVQAAHSGRRTLCVLPTEDRAAAAEARMRARYQRLGLRIGQLLSSGGPAVRDLPTAADETAELPSDLSDLSDLFEDLDVVLVSAAGLSQRIVQQPLLLASVDLVLVDELEALADPRLGPAIELALLWLQRTRSARPVGPEPGRGPRLLAVCGEVAGLPALAAALQAELIFDERRPCELRSGVVHGGRLSYVSSRDDRGSDRRYEEELHEPPRPLRSTTPGEDHTARLVTELCMRGEQTLVLVPDRARAVIAAEQLTAALRACPPAPATEALTRLAETADGQARTLLRETLSRGVALLDDGMLPSQRALVLAACRDGEVRVLCATTPGELAQELDPELGFRNVIVTERWVWRYQRRTRGYARSELGWLDWARIGGRAARPRVGGTAPGRAMLLVPSRYDAEVVLRGRVAALPEPLSPALRAEPLEELVLALVAGQACSCEVELVETLTTSISGQALWSSASGAGELRTRVGSAIETLVAQELLLRDFTAGTVLRVTPLGRLTAGLGLPVRTILLMLRWAEAARQVDFTSLEVLVALALSPSGVEAAVPLLLSEQEANDYWSRTLIRAAAAGAAERPLFRWLRAQAGVVRFEQTRALKKALLLCDWVAGREGAALETDYHVWLGSLVRVAADFGRLVAALRAVCALRGWDAARLQVLDALAERLRQAPHERAASGVVATRVAVSRVDALRVDDSRVDASRVDASRGPDRVGARVGEPADRTAPDSGAVVARAVFSIRAALLAGRNAAASSVPATATAAAAAGASSASVGRVGKGLAGATVADHTIEPR